jgi:exodeoxyribonuclease VII small subunit
MDDAPGYKEAIEEIELIVEEIENESIDIDVLSDKVKRAAYLIKHCKSKLKSADNEVKKVLKDLEKES